MRTPGKPMLVVCLLAITIDRSYGAPGPSECSRPLDAFTEEAEGSRCVRQEVIPPPGPWQHIAVNGRPLHVKGDMSGGNLVVCWAAAGAKSHSCVVVARAPTVTQVLQYWQIVLMFFETARYLDAAPRSK